MSNQSIEIIEKKDNFRIELHPVGGLRFIFENYIKGLSSKQSAVEVLNKLNIEHTVLIDCSVCTVIRILSGKFKGDYDTNFDFDRGVFSLIQDRG